ncbi:MAG: TrmH family RNA methyltransferase [Patescibacteria group bacterium]
MTELILIAHNLRSAHNIGSLLRTAEGLGVGKMWLSGYSPYPLAKTYLAGKTDSVSRDDDRLPHLAQKIDKQIAKTALGAENTLAWEHQDEIADLLKELKQAGYLVVALEQAPNAVKLPDFRLPDSPVEPALPAKLALIVGREVEGIEPEIMAMCDQILEIPMFGRKESFNVVQAAAMALYHLRFVA